MAAFYGVFWTIECPEGGYSGGKGAATGLIEPDPEGLISASRSDTGTLR